MLKAYFKKEPGPFPLHASFERRVRFEECDMLGIMWHGRYASYFEDAREAMSDKYGISYGKLQEDGVITPIFSFHIDFMRPLEYRKSYTVHTFMHWTEAARINIEYKITGAEGKLHTRGYSIQLLVDLDGQLLFAQPESYAAFLRRWRDGELN